jgi:uncharacterized protein YdbL (DUF1318 family)
MKISFLRLIALSIALLVGGMAVTAHAQDLNAVKNRMAQRLSKLDEFKAKGLLGENNKGFVELRGSDAAAGDVMAEENKDRGDVYAAIAKSNGTSADQVGRARARKIATESAAGVWLQKDDGSWYKK